MAAVEEGKHHVPGIFGGDLPREEQDAFEETHDADIPAGENEAASKSDHDSLKKDVAVGTEQGEKPGSSNSSEDGVPIDRDVEKGEPETSVTEESKEPVDPNIVDWDGPEDPQNPMNWRGLLISQIDCCN